MPRSGSPLQFNAESITSKYTELYYTDYDIELLHQIVVYAQDLLSSKVLPTNALFSAYYVLLEQRQIRPEHDDRYARVLFRICTLRGPETLLEKFEAVLWKMGIRVEFYNPSQKEEHECDFLKIQRFEDFFTNATEKNYPLLTSTPKRCNSENSMWNIATGEKSKLRKRRINSFSSIPQHKPGFDAEKDPTQIRLDFQRFKREAFFTSTKDNSNTQRVGAWLALEPLHLRSSFLCSRDGSQIDKKLKKRLRSQQNQTSLTASTDFQISSFTIPLSSLIYEDTPAHSSSSSPKELISKYGTLLDMEAKLISNQHLALYTKSKIQAWKNLAIKLQRDNLYLDFVATNQYSNTVLRAAFDKWCIKVQKKRNSKQISRYYSHLKKCATRARNLYLLYVAFSHWLNFKTDRIQLTAKIRKRIIQTRIFNVWRDITAADELKVKHQILRRNFCFWKYRYFSSEARRNTAVNRYNASIIQKYISVWKLRFLSIRMRNSRTYRSIHLILIEWNFKSQSIGKQKCDAEIFRHSHLYLNVINPWIHQTMELLFHGQKAEALYMSKMAKIIFFQWSKELTLVLALKKFQNQILRRQARNFFFLWLYQTRQERKAVVTDRMKIMREAWTNWRIKTRAKLFRLRSENFIIEHIIYIWILRARSKLAIRLRNENFLRDMIYIWNFKSQTLKKNQLKHETLAREIFDRNTKNFVLLQWYLRMGNLQKSGIIAFNLYQPRIFKFIIQLWASNLQHLQKLDQWSKDAGYYLLASRVMKKWKASIENAKRNKRKNAYVIVRRKIKINLLHRVMQIWIKETQEILKLQIWATEISQTQIFITGREIFYRWCSYTEELLELKLIWKKKLLRKYVATWLSKTKHVLALEPEAKFIYQERQMSKILQKWSHHSLHIIAYENPAYEIREKNFRKNKRRMFICWRDKVKFHKVTSNQVLPDPELEEIAQNEAWSEFGEEVNNKNNQEERDFVQDMTPSSIPAYLNTPSKRSERIKAVVAKYSKFPITPLPKTRNREFRVTRTEGLFSSIQKKRLNNLTLSINDTM